MRVGVWTLEYLMSFFMNITSGMDVTGVMDKELIMEYFSLVALTWIIDDVVAARNDIISCVTGCLEKILRASRSDIVISSDKQ